VLPVVGGETSAGVIRIEPIDVLYPGPRLFTGSSASGMALADFDRDGIGDLAVAHAVSNSGLTILAGQRDGRFTLRQRLAMSGEVAAGDLTLDGAPDLLAAVRDADGVTHRFVVLLNTGDGTFEIGPSRTIGAVPAQVRIGDVDGDGMLDVLFASRASAAVFVLLGNGDGTLRPETGFPLDGSPEDVATGDWNLDGRLDVAIAVTKPAAPHAVVVLLGDAAGGLVAAGALPFSLALLALTVGDFDGDGWSDLGVGAGRFSDNQRAYIALGHGDGSFALASTSGSAILGSPRSMASDDLDGDGALDLAIARDRSPCDDILLLRGDGAGGLLINEPRSIIDTCDPPRFVTSDLTGDGLPELVALDDSGVTTYLGAGGLTFERRRDLETTSKPDELAASDFDRDGRLDLVYNFDASKSLGIQLGNGDGTFRATGHLAGIFIHQLASGDVNRDGVPDLVVSSLDEVGTLLGRGDGTFAEPVLLPIQRGSSSLIATDLTGDGATDVVTTNAATDELLFYESRGDGTLEFPSSSPVGDTPRGVVFADLDRDGILDAAVVNSSSDDVSILLGTGGGRFGPQARFPVRNEPDSIAAADLDLDGAVDLVIVGRTSTPPLVGTATVVMGDGEGGFGAPIAIESASSVTRVAAAEVDLDGVPDLVLLHPTDDLSILLGVGDGTFLPAERTRTGDGPSRIVVADVDGDGQADLVTTNVGTIRPGLSVLLHR
jgi:hypothetical protein